jgi:lipid II:glycine glycyltransferase (peptidoglycan interpeptide bridge formation enzyme)
MAFFKAIDTLLLGNVYTLEARLDDIVIALLVNLHFGDIAYTWLSASDSKYFSQHPNEALVFLSAIEAGKRGCKKIVLGGGVGGIHDSLFQYKIAFSGLTSDFFSYQKVYLPEEYEKLNEIQRHRYPNSKTGFFPRYRSFTA